MIEPATSLDAMMDDVTDHRCGADGASLSIGFPLEIEDDWPPVSLECMPFRLVLGGYALLAPPLFVKGLSVGDVLDIELDDQRATAWRHRSRSGNTTMWMLRIHTSDALDGVLHRLRELGCLTAELTSYGAYAASIPASIPLTTIEELLAELDPAAVAVAFPSLRHEDGE